MCQVSNINIDLCKPNVMYNICYQDFYFIIIYVLRLTLLSVYVKLYVGLFLLQHNGH